MEDATQQAGKKGIIQIRVRPEIKAQIERLAEQDGITVTALVTQLLMRAIAAKR